METKVNDLRRGGNVIRTALEELDVFGVFDGPPPAPTSHLTVQQYVRLVRHVGEKLGVEDVSFFFNLPLMAVSDDDDEEGGVALDDCGHPPVCAHLARESGMQAVGHPELLPVVACDDAREAVRGPPYVHCLFCLQEGRTDCCRPLLVPNLRHSVLTHYMQHMHRRDECLALLEDEVVLHRGDEVCGTDLSDETQVQALERAAESDGRHACFVVSAGTVACPVMVAYCAACDQLAPLATFTTIPKGDNVEQNKPHQSEKLEAQSVEVSELILARLLLACEFLFALKCERNQVNGRSMPCVQEESYVFLATPFLFGEDREDLTDAFESGVVLTHTSAILPFATLTSDTPDDPRLCLGEAGAVTRVLRDDLPPYRFKDAVVGFVLQWASESEAEEKVRWALRQDSGLRVQRRLVYVEDTDEWVIARVFYHIDAKPTESKQGNDQEGEERQREKEDVCGSFRRREDCSIFKMVPLSLLHQYEGREERRNGDENYDKSNDINDTNHMSVRGESEMEGCPYGMESRTIHFFTSMMALAKAMKMVGEHFKEKEPHE